MENQLSNGTVAVPQITITEPSPLIQTTSVVSIAEMAGHAPEAKVVDSTHRVPNGAAQDEPPCEQATAAREQPESNSSGEFTSAQECTECLVSVPEQETQSTPTEMLEDARTVSVDTDHDDFRTPSTPACCSMLFACWLRYKRFWEIVDWRFRLPFWMMLFALPISAGLMGSFYMFSCPAADTLPSAIFSTGISLLAVLTVRVCIRLHKMMYEDSEFRHALSTLLLITTFVMAMFFLTESVMFWQMDSTSEPGAKEYCNPKLVEYAFWWNCVMPVAMVPLLVAPS